jgi:hypothetical protein
MKTIHLTSIVSILFCSAIIFACKKSSNNNPFGGSKIATIEYTHSGGGRHYNLFYGAYSDLDSMHWTGTGTSSGSSGYKKFSYFGTSFNITDETNFTYTVYANSNGQILKVLVTDTLGFSYSNNEIKQMQVYTHTASYPFYKYVATDYYWKNGDLASFTSENATTVFDYDLTKFGQPGDAIRMSEFLLYGRSFIKTIHLPSLLSKNSVWTEKYLYQFDGSGRISQMSKISNNLGITPDDTATYGYTYY